MNPVAEVFAEMTGALEDMHAIAVEGQKADMTPDEAWALLGLLRNNIRGLSRLLAAAALTLQ